MSKDKGVKNVKKAPADKSLGKAKPVSAYKSESKSAGIKSSSDSLIAKTDSKSGGKKA